jgi:Protein phosphatase 2C
MGWRPILGVHVLIHLMCFELSLGEKVPAIVWDKFLVGGHAKHCDEYSSFSSALIEPVHGKMIVCVACEAFTIDPKKRAVEDVQPYGYAVLEYFEKKFHHIHLEADLESLFKDSLLGAEELISAEDIGVCVCITSVTKEKVVSVNLGNIGSYLLQTNKRKCKSLSVSHDAFDPEEIERLKELNVDFVKHGSSVRYIKDLSEVSRCLGLKGCGFISHDPHVYVSNRELDDSVLVVGNRNVFEGTPAIEISSMICPKVSAVEMCSEVVRISKLRIGKDPKIGLNVICL